VIEKPTIALEQKPHRQVVWVRGRWILSFQFLFVDNNDDNFELRTFAQGQQVLIKCLGFLRFT
jgi:hypothetical protein